MPWHGTRMNSVDLEPALIRLADEVDQGIRSHGYRAAKRGELHRLSPGTYVPAAEWDALGDDARHLLLVRSAFPRVHPTEVLSHWSAAALWTLPIIGRWPTTVHVTAPPDAARRSTSTLTRHRRGLVDATALRDGLPVTSLAETVVDVARVAPFATALAMADAALRQHDRQNVVPPAAKDLRLELARVIHDTIERRGIARARRVADIADGRADRPGESLSRATMIELGVPLPKLQHCIVSSTGKVYFLDFFWPDQNIGADFDGKLKYLDPAFRDGRTAEQVVYDEKVREDEVRLELNGYGRWDWTVAGSRRLLAERLRRIGLRW